MRTLDDRYAYDEARPPRRGGMATVVEAMDTQRLIKVAIKFVEDDPALSLAFQRESKALQTFSHPNIVELLDGGREPDSGRHYLVLEWLDRDLTQYLSKHPLAGWDDFFERIARPMLSALQYALGQGWIHRDLKPSNVLVAESGDLKISDFGISRLIREPRLGQTLQDRRSEPYAPPESDSGSFEGARDVYSFAVLAIQCLAADKLLSREAVLRALRSNDADLPDEVQEVLEACLSESPADRPENVAVLAADLERIHNRRSGAWDRRAYYVQVSSHAQRRMQRLMPKLTLRDSYERILEELSGAREYRLRPPEDGVNKGIRIRVMGSHFELSLQQDPHFPGCLLVENITFRTPSELNLDRDAAWSHRGIRFERGKPPDAATAIVAVRAFIDELAQHEARLKEQEARAEDERLFKEWRSLLSARELISQGAIRPVRFSRLQAEGTRVRLTVNEVPPSELLDEAVMIPLPDRTYIAGQVEQLGAGEVVLFVDAPLPEHLPQNGELRIDNRATRIALGRESRALDSVRFRRSVRADLRDLLTYPVRCVPPSLRDRIDPQQELDSDQLRALNGALGTKDVYVLEGPPGTGKTRLITELIVQLTKSHGKRTLLCSQTHVALDNALERVTSLAPGVKVVRVGHRGDPHIAPSSERLLLPFLANEWAKTVRKSSQDFLVTWAAEKGLDAHQVALGVAASYYRAALENHAALQNQLASIQTDLVAAQSQIDAETKTGVGDSSPELDETIKGLHERRQTLQRRLETSNAEIAVTRKRLVELDEDALGLAAMSLEELTEWESFLLRDHPAGDRFRDLRELLDEWQLRLARADDFQRALLKQADVVAATCVGFAGLPDWQETDFDFCIVDEASKALPTELLVPMSRARVTVLVGDPRQLPPFLERELQDAKFLDKYGLQRASVERTLLATLLEALPAECVSRLAFQHRMTPAIGELISQCFYDGELKSTRPPATLFAPVLPAPVTWVSTSSLSQRREIQEGFSYCNLTEIRAIVETIRQLEKWMSLRPEKQRKTFTVVCLAGYLAQVRELERAVAALRNQKYFTVSCASVDSYQGREADVAVYSITRSNDRGEIGFLAERRRLNVALSRGRDQLVIVGDFDFLSHLTKESSFREISSFFLDNPTICALRDAPQ